MRYWILLFCITAACANKPTVFVAKEGRIPINQIEETDKTNTKEQAVKVLLPQPKVLQTLHGHEELLHPHHSVNNIQTFKSVGLSGTPEYFNVVSDGKFLYIPEQKSIARIDLKTNKKEKFIAMGFDKYARIILLAHDQNYLSAVNSLGDLVVYDLKTKQNVWSKQLKGVIRSAPVIDKGQLFIQTSENMSFAFDLKTGKALWEHQGNLELINYERGSQIAVTGDKVVIVYTSGEIVVLERSSGASIWSDIMLPPSEYEGHLTHIVASPIIDGNHIYVMSYGQVLAAYSLSTGDTFWRKNIGGIHTPLLAGNYLYAINHHNQILAYNKNTGSLRFKTQLKGDGFTNLLLVNNQIAVANNKGEIYYIDPSNGGIVNIVKNGSGWPQQITSVQNHLIFVTKNRISIS